MAKPGKTVQEAGVITDLAGHAIPGLSGQPPEPEQRRPIQVLIANLPDLVYQLVAGPIEREPDMVLRALPLDPAQDRVERARDLLVASASIDVLILGVERLVPLPGICSHLLNAFPYLKVIALAENGEAAMLYWLGLRRQRLRLVSASSLVRSIRRVHMANQTE
jgi:hypothetical protein